MDNVKLLGKPIEFIATSGLNEKYGGIELAGYIHIALAILQKHPHDMLVFSMANDNHLQVRLAGYHLETEVLDETSVVFKTESLHIDTFWLKIDDYGDKYIGTFLFPEEY
jgi:uncharacterized protein YfaT (DUF1175 family)